MTLKTHLAPSAQFAQRASPFETYSPQGYRPLRREAYTAKRQPTLTFQALLNLATALAALGLVLSWAWPH